MLFTHIHLLCYCVVFLNNQRRHPEVISLLTTTILSLSLNSLGCYGGAVAEWVKAPLHDTIRPHGACRLLCTWVNRNV